MNTGFAFMYPNNDIIHYIYIMAHANFISNANYTDTSHGDECMWRLEVNIKVIKNLVWWHVQ